MTKLDP
jgi:hypothetical protein